MMSLLLSVLPLALGAALSPVLLTVEILILSGKTKPKARSWLFVLGAIAVLLGFTFLAVTVMSNFGDAGTGKPSTESIVIMIIAAVLLFALGGQALRPGRTASEKHASRVSGRFAAAKLPFFFGAGAVTMLVNLSTLVLYIPAIHLIMRSNASSSAKLSAGVMLFLITVAPFLLPVTAVTLFGHRSDAFLAKLNSFVTAHSRQINAGICLGFGVLLTYSAVKDLVS